MRLRKKGLSQIIATVLLILLTLAAVAILASFLVPYVKDSLTESTECIRYREYFKFDSDSKYNCFKDVGENKKEYRITIEASTPGGDESNVKGFTLIFFSESRESSTSVSSESPTNIKMFGNPNELIKILKKGETYTYTYTDSESYSKAEVLPILKSGKVCPKTDTIAIYKCT